MNWTITAGPRQSKIVKDAMSELKRAGQSFRELYDHGASVLWSPLSPVRPEAKAAEAAIGERFAWTITRENYAQVAEAFNKAAADLPLPTQDRRSTPEQIAERAARVAAQKAQDDERERAGRENMRILKERMPAGAQAIIVAELIEDQSDTSSDYFASRATEAHVIGFRMSKREDFRALRAAAARHPETEHLGPGRNGYKLFLAYDHDSTDESGRARLFIRVDESVRYYKGSAMPSHWAPDGYANNPDGYSLCLAEFDNKAAADAWIESHPAPSGTEWRVDVQDYEHRENWSMGGGNYLKAGYRHSCGWRVSSDPIPNDFAPDCSWLLREPLPEPMTEESNPSESATLSENFGGAKIEKHYHTKKCRDMFLVILSERVDREQFEAIRRQCQDAGGWYSRAWGRTPGGFAFWSKEEAVDFAAGLTCAAAAA